jgi:hypothetical protein
MYGQSSPLVSWRSDWLTIMHVTIVLIPTAPTVAGAQRVIASIYMCVSEYELVRCEVVWAEAKCTHAQCSSMIG